MVYLIAEDYFKTGFLESLWYSIYGRLLTFFVLNFL